MKEIPWAELLKVASKARNNSFIYGDTKVGAAVYTENGNINGGCNVEHIYRSHDIHAEVNAIGNMIASGETKFKAILIVAERDFFTPCGSCMDWIMQHAMEDCIVAFDNLKGHRTEFTTKDLMPHYPR
ncbi:cytidine deaminase family protein [Labilibaculum euxinus]